MTWQVRTSACCLLFIFPSYLIFFSLSLLSFTQVSFMNTAIHILLYFVCIFNPAPQPTSVSTSRLRQLSGFTWRQMAPCATQHRYTPSSSLLANLSVLCIPEEPQSLNCSYCLPGCGSLEKSPNCSGTENQWWMIQFDVCNSTRCASKSSSVCH